MQKQGVQIPDSELYYINPFGERIKKQLTPAKLAEIEKAAMKDAKKKARQARLDQATKLANTRTNNPRLYKGTNRKFDQATDQYVLRLGKIPRNKEAVEKFMQKLDKELAEREEKMRQKELNDTAVAKATGRINGNYPYGSEKRRRIDQFTMKKGRRPTETEIQEIKEKHDVELEEAKKRRKREENQKAIEQAETQALMEKMEKEKPKINNKIKVPKKKNR